MHRKLCLLELGKQVMMIWIDLTASVSKLVDRSISKKLDHSKLRNHWQWGKLILKLCWRWALLQCRGKYRIDALALGIRCVLPEKFQASLSGARRRTSLSAKSLLTVGIAGKNAFQVSRQQPLV